MPSSHTGAVWRVRAGLNVAALTCRGPGRKPVAQDYRRMLQRHADLLNRAHAEEQRRLGPAGFDRAQTRHYNRMANQRSPGQFCQTAANIAGRINTMDSPRFNAAASGLAAELEAAAR